MWSAHPEGIRRARAVCTQSRRRNSTRALRGKTRFEHIRYDMDRCIRDLGAQPISTELTFQNRKQSTAVTKSNLRLNRTVTVCLNVGFSSRFKTHGTSWTVTVFCQADDSCLSVQQKFPLTNIRDVHCWHSQTMGTHKNTK